MAKQSAGKPIPPVPAGNPSGNPSPAATPAAPPVSPAVARAREGAAAAQGHGSSGK